MNNVVYGKTMENTRKRGKTRIVKNSKDLIKYTSKSTCVSWNIFDKKLAAIREKKILILKKPIYVGFTVLEISKWEKYNFHYNLWSKKATLNYYLQTQIVYVMKFMGKIYK